jgi:hypothetical protein
VVRVIALVAAGAVGWSSTASAYVGPSWLIIPGKPGHYNDGRFKKAILARASKWPGRLKTINSHGFTLAGDKLYFGGPQATKDGNSGKLIVTVNVNDPDIAIMRELCANKTAVPQLQYAESSWRARPVLELGPRPADIPEVFLYQLENATVTDCPYYEGAAEQMFQFQFGNIKWLNYDPNRRFDNRIEVRPEDLPQVFPANAGKGVKSYLITWIGLATDAAEDQCPKMNNPPSDDDYFRFKTEEEKAKVMDRYKERGLDERQLSQRAPLGQSVMEFPGTVPDPGIVEPLPTVALGVDLDGNDGRGSPRRGYRKHANYMSPDGRKGIDNELHRVLGCVLGYRGKKGYRNQTSNARRADGNIVTLIEVSGIDDERNDNDVTVKIIHSLDTPVKDNSGKIFIANYTYTPTDDPNFALYNHQLRGRIVNGVIETDPVPSFLMNLGQDPEWDMREARFRLAPNPDGSVTGVLAGYRDWNKLLDVLSNERTYHYSKVAAYYAMRRNADGLYNPATKEYDGISGAYEIEAVPAFVVPSLKSGPNVAAAEAQPEKRP